jgi:hypothetical protein
MPWYRWCWRLQRIGGCLSTGGGGVSGGSWDGLTPAVLVPPEDRGMPQHRRCEGFGRVGAAKSPPPGRRRRRSGRVDRREQGLERRRAAQPRRVADDPARGRRGWRHLPRAHQSTSPESPVSCLAPRRGSGRVDRREQGLERRRGAEPRLCGLPGGAARGGGLRRERLGGEGEVVFVVEGARCLWASGCGRNPWCRGGSRAAIGAPRLARSPAGPRRRRGCGRASSRRCSRG